MILKYAIITAVLATFAYASTQENAEQIRIRSTEMKRKADSLKMVWEVQWRRSDSLRIESMFVRMRSDSLRRVAKNLLILADSMRKGLQDTVGTSDTTMMNLLDTNAKLRANIEKAQRAKPKAGQTLSDTATLSLLAIEADTGIASYYAEAFHGRLTSSGERYDMNGYTCAHRWLPYNTKLFVTNMSNGKTVIVRVNDRGPFKHTRIIDLSKGAAVELEMIRSGTSRVVIRVQTGPE